jgi:MYXO-CTERM domain-containing protein
VIVTQQLSNVGGATRMGTVFGTAAGAAPAVGSTTAGLYMSNATTTAGFYTFTGYATNSNGVYQLNTVDAPAPGALALLGVAGIAGKRRRR